MKHSLFFRKQLNELQEDKARTVDHDHNYFNSVINCFSHQNNKYFCDFCPFEAQNYKAIVKHLKRHRTCWICSKRFFGSIFQWKRHTKTCTGVKKDNNQNTICQYCKKDFIFHSKLRKHIYKCELRHKLVNSLSSYGIWKRLYWYKCYVSCISAVVITWNIIFKIDSELLFFSWLSWSELP